MSHESAPPRPGTLAPNFSLPRTSYESLSLSDLAGHPAVLVFYPGDWEPVSRHQLTSYQQHLPELQRFRAALLGISVDSLWSHEAFGRAFHLTFPLLSDSHPIGSVSRAYGVYRQEEDRCCRALIVLDGGGRVFWSHTYPFNLDPGIDGVLTALEVMQARERDQ